MADCNELEDWELLQSPDAIPSVASTVDHEFFVLNHFVDKKSSGSVDDRVLLSGENEDSTVGRREKDNLFNQGVDEGSFGDSLDSRDEVVAEKKEKFISGIVDVVVEDVRTKTSSGVSSGLSSSDLDGTLENSLDFSRNNCNSGGVMEATDVNVSGEGSGLTGVIEDVEVKYDVEPSPDVNVSGERTVAQSASGNLPVENARRSDILVWWKVPLNLVKYCVFKIKPVWSLSMAVAIVGFAMFGRKLYMMMKRKGLTVPVGVGFDAKKVPKSVAQHALLKETVLAMRRVPLIKASLPYTGITSWPTLALR